MSLPPIAVLWPRIEVYCDGCNRRFPETQVDRESGLCSGCRDEDYVPEGFAPDSKIHVNVWVDEGFDITRAEWDGNEEQWVATVQALRSGDHSKVPSMVRHRIERSLDIHPEIDLSIMDPKRQVAVVPVQGGLL